MIKIFVSTFNKKVMTIKFGIPIEVGAANRDTFIYDMKDCTADSISNLNCYFGELTGLYWIWKNLSFNDGDYIGYCHYNKCLDLKRKDYKLINKKENIWFVTEPFKNRDHPIQSEIDSIVRILEKDYPEYAQIWHELYNDDGSGKGEVCMGCNIFLTQNSEFRKYCEFLFDVLFRLNGVVGEGSDDLNLKRYCAFMGERLLSVYLITNNCKVIPVKMKNSQWYLPYVKSIASTLKISKESSMYVLLKKYFGYKSSYGRK